MMKFFKRNKRKYSLADMTSRVRGYVLDSQVTDAHHIAELLGCSVLSDEVAEKEEAESDERVAEISHLIPVAYAYAKLLADGMVEHQRAHMDTDEMEMDPELMERAWTSTRKVFTGLALNAVIGALSQMVDLNLLSVPKHRKGLF